MNMIFCGLLIQKKHARMMIEFYHKHRALYPIVERIIVTVATNPAEISFIPVFRDLVHSSMEGTRWKNVEIERNALQKLILLKLGHLNSCDSFIWDSSVILKSPSKVPLRMS